MRVLFTVLLLAATTAAAQPFDTVVSGTDHICDIPEMNSRETVWLGTNGVPNDGLPDILGIAPAPGGRVYATVFTSASESAFVVAEIRPDGSRMPITAPISRLPLAMVVAESGAIYVLYTRASYSSPRLIAFNPDGSVRADYVFSGPHTAANSFPFTAMDLAADQCTLYLIQPFGTIRRFNVCTGAFLPDFGTTQARYGVAIRVLPDGGLLVSTESHDHNERYLERFAADGTFIQSFPVQNEDGPIGALMLVNGGTHVKYGATGCISSLLVTMDLASGALVSTVPLDMAIPQTIVASNGWTAALGATHAHAIPATGPIALMAIAMMLVLAALLRLR